MKIRENSNRKSMALRVYVAPLLASAAGLVLIILAFTASFPEASSLSEVRGHLDSYGFYQTGRGKGDYETIISLQEGSRFWTNAIDKDDAEVILRERGLGVRYYIDPHSTNKPMDGDAVKAYGLWIDGRQIRSVEEAIEHDKVAVRFGLPALGIFWLGLSVLIYRKKKAQYARHA